MWGFAGRMWSATNAAILAATTLLPDGGNDKLSWLRANCVYVSVCVHVSVVNGLSDTLSLPRVPWVWSGCSTIFLVPVPPVCIDIEWTNVLSHVRVLSAVWCGTSFVWHPHPNV